MVTYGCDGRGRAGRVRHYLLEKARVVSQHEGERNYHVFYHVCAGVSGSLKDALHLSNPQVPCLRLPPPSWSRPRRLGLRSGLLPLPTPLFSLSMSRRRPGEQGAKGRAKGGAKRDFKVAGRGWRGP
jgi:hypothetical protein